VSEKSRERHGKKGGHQPTPEQMEKLIELYEKYNDQNVPEDQRPTQQQLAEESGISQTVISYWFRKFDEQERMGPEAPGTLEPVRPGRKEQDRALTRTEKTTTGRALKDLSSRAASIYEQAISIGNLVVDKYDDLVKIALENGVKLEDFMADVFNWYEAREETLQRIHRMELELNEFRELSAANYIFKHKSQCIVDFAKTIAELNASGGHINMKQAARALQNDLERIEQEITEKFPKKEMIPVG
jgi:hypothetical protein